MLLTMIKFEAFTSKPKAFLQEQPLWRRLEPLSKNLKNRANSSSATATYTAKKATT